MFSEEELANSCGLGIHTTTTKSATSKQSIPKLALDSYKVAACKGRLSKSRDIWPLSEPRGQGNVLACKVIIGPHVALLVRVAFLCLPSFVPDLTLFGLLNSQNIWRRSASTTRKHIPTARRWIRLSRSRSLTRGWKPVEKRKLSIKDRTISTFNFTSRTKHPLSFIIKSTVIKIAINLHTSIDRSFG